jgi:methionyl-tRNA formyltransferase
VGGIRLLSPDLQVMAFVTLFVPEEFLTSHLRLHSVSSLALAGRPRRIGHQLADHQWRKGNRAFHLLADNGLDTGDVLLQKRTPISDTDTLGTVYFDRLFPMGVEAMMESIDLVKDGNAPASSRTKISRPMKACAKPRTRRSIGASPGVRSTG